jgi:hypothetical protein
VGKKLIELDLVPKSLDKENTVYFANLLRDYARASFTSLLTSIVSGGVDEKEKTR